MVHNQKSTSQATEVFDFREASPSNLDRQDFEGKSASEIDNQLTIGVPGFVRGMQLLHNKYGRYVVLFNNALCVD